MQRKVLSREQISNFCESAFGKTLRLSFVEPKEDFLGAGEEGLIAALAVSEADAELERLRPLPSLPSFSGLMVEPFNPDNLDLTSLDLTVGDEIYEYPVVYSDMSLARLMELAKQGKAKRHCLKPDEEFVFFPKSQGECNIYYVVSQEKIQLPERFGIFIDSKSTLGRLGCICHGVTGPSQLKNGCKIVAAVRPYFFPIKARAGKSKLFQAAFTMNGDSHMPRDKLLNCKKLEVYIDDKKMRLEEVSHEDKLELTYLTQRFYVSKRLSKRAIKCIEPIDVDARGIDWKPYFESREGDGEVVTEPRRLYLFGTRENLRFREVCGRIERAPGGELSGCWGQFAGIIQAGFEGRITMEYMTTERRALINGGLAGRVEIDEILGRVDMGMAKRGYFHQDAPALAKVFAS